MSAILRKILFRVLTWNRGLTRISPFARNLVWREIQTPVQSQLCFIILHPSSLLIILSGYFLRKHIYIHINIFLQVDSKHILLKEIFNLLYFWIIDLFMI